MPIIAIDYNRAMILGIDEVGRGPWAGPLVVGAVVLGGTHIEGLNDSKLLSKKKRELLHDEIYARASGVGLGWVSAEELDEVGMSEALRLATRRAVKQVKTPFHEIIIDGTINLLVGTPLEGYVTTLKKADQLVPSVSAASIVAKVARDRYMAEQADVYPQYGFNKHAGYGVAAHRAAIEAHGVTPLHRLSFAPLVKYRTAKGRTETAPTPEKPITTRAVGDKSEAAAARYLEANGHTIVERNWRTKWCEIDIISRKNNRVYFTEVKHRKNDRSGDGLAAITPKKLKQMRFAAELYAVHHTNTDLQLAALATSGTPARVVDYILIND